MRSVSKEGQARQLFGPFFEVRAAFCVFTVILGLGSVVFRNPTRNEVTRAPKNGVYDLDDIKELMVLFAVNRGR